MLVEQLRSPDKKFFQIGLMTARQAKAAGVADALAAEFSHAPPGRAALLLRAPADRAEHVVPPAVVEAAKSGPKPVRIAAIEFIGRWGDASSVSALLQNASEPDKELAEAARTALGTLAGEKVDAEIADRLTSADAGSQLLLIELRRPTANPSRSRAGQSARKPGSGNSPCSADRAGKHRRAGQAFCACVAFHRAERPGRCGDRAQGAFGGQRSHARSRRLFRGACGRPAAGVGCGQGRAVGDSRRRGGPKGARHDRGRHEER